MQAHEIIELSAAAVSASVETALVNTLDAGITGVKSDESTKRRAVGLMVRTANTGIVVGRLDQTPVITIEMASANGMYIPIELDIPIAVGQALTFTSKSSSGTARCSVSVLIRHD